MINSMEVDRETSDSFEFSDKEDEDLFLTLISEPAKIPKAESEIRTYENPKLGSIQIIEKTNRKRKSNSIKSTISSPIDSLPVSNSLSSKLEPEDSQKLRIFENLLSQFNSGNMSTCFSELLNHCENDVTIQVTTTGISSTIPPSIFQDSSQKLPSIHTSTIYEPTILFEGVGVMKVLMFFRVLFTSPDMILVPLTPFSISLCPNPTPNPQDLLSPLYTHIQTAVNLKGTIVLRKTFSCPIKILSNMLLNAGYSLPSPPEDSSEPSVSEGYLHLLLSQPVGHEVGSSLTDNELLPEPYLLNMVGSFSMVYSPHPRNKLKQIKFMLEYV